MKTQKSIEALFTYQLHALRKQIDRIMSDAYSAALSLSLPEARVLLNAGSKGPRSVTELAKASHLDRSRASRATDSLERRGLVRKDASEVDGRGVVVKLTDKGQAAFDCAIEIARGKNAEILSPLSAQEAAQLSLLCAKLIASDDNGD